MAAPLQCDDRRGVDQDPLRHRARRAASHIIVVIYAFVSIIGFFTYAFKGIGKFAQTYLPWHLSANEYALILIAITAIYVIKGGMISVVITEVVQFFILSIASFAVGIIAMSKVAPEMLHRVVPRVGTTSSLAGIWAWTGQRSCRRRRKRSPKTATNSSASS